MTALELIRKMRETKYVSTYQNFNGCCWHDSKEFDEVKFNYDLDVIEAEIHRLIKEKQK
jgi:hypothetical protein